MKSNLVISIDVPTLFSIYFLKEFRHLQKIVAEIRRLSVFGGGTLAWPGFLRISGFILAHFSQALWITKKKSMVTLATCGVC